MSRSEARSNPVALSGATVRGPVYVYLSSAGSIDKAEFFLDKKGAVDRPRQVDRWAPFDFAGTRHAGSPRAFRSYEVPDGIHEITARLTLEGGAKKTVSARFRVANGGEATPASTTTTTTTAPAAPAPAPTTTTTAPPAPPPSAVPSGAFPTAASTGWRPTGVTLAPYTGPCAITVAGTVIDSADIGCSTVTIQAPDVTISRSRITATGDYGILVRSPRLVVSDTEITGSANRSIGSWGGNATYRRVLIHNVHVGIAVGSGDRIEASYIDDLDNPASGGHANAVLSNGEARDVTIVGNTLGCGTNHCSSAISAYPESGPNSGWSVDGNLLNGGAYCVFFGHTPPESPNTNMRVTNNTFGNRYYRECGMYGPVASWTPPPTGAGNYWSGNVFATGGEVRP